MDRNDDRVPLKIRTDSIILNNNNETVRKEKKNGRNVRIVVFRSTDIRVSAKIRLKNV